MQHIGRLALGSVSSVQLCLYDICYQSAALPARSRVDLTFAQERAAASAQLYQQTLAQERADAPAGTTSRVPVEGVVPAVGGVYRLEPRVGKPQAYVCKSSPPPS